MAIRENEHSSPTILSSLPNLPIWLTIAGLFLCVFGAVVSTSISAGELRARVTTLEMQATTAVHKDEWNQAIQDISQRLGRIENALDKQTGK